MRSGVGGNTSMRVVFGVSLLLAMLTWPSQVLRAGDSDDDDSDDEDSVVNGVSVGGDDTTDGADANEKNVDGCS